MVTKEELIEKHRDINVDYEWWEYAYEVFISDMEKVGICVDKEDISFEGFYHQGSHASMDCTSNRWMPLLMEAHNLDKTYNAIYKLAIQNGVHMVKKGRHIDIDMENWEFFDACEDADMNGYYQIEYQEEVDATYAQFEKDIVKIIDDYEDELYKTLQNEYEYLCSDEAVWETIVANDLDDELDEKIINRGLQVGGAFL